MEGIVTNEAIKTKYGAQPKTAGCLASVDIHTYGHAALISTYNSDDIIIDAAQVSYGKTLGIATSKPRTIGETNRLIRYLYRHRHTSPFEMAEAQFYLRMPIFVARQYVRHRTANLNEYSGRYSELSSDFYTPAAEVLQPQSKSNKQGREGELETAALMKASNILVSAQASAMDAYKELLDLGVAREIARIVTPVGTYTEMYWKCDVHNLLHLLKLRVDRHAQQEIRDFANAIYEMVKPFFPLTFKAWEDYSLNAYTLSSLEQDLLSEVLRHPVKLADYIKHPTTEWPKKPLAMSDREFNDFRFFLDTLLSKS